MAVNFQTDVPLAEHTTFKVGGLAASFVAVHSERELEAVFSTLEKKAESAVILGGGSNVLISDRGVSQTVIKMKIDGIAAEENEAEVLVTAGAGVVFDDLVAYAAEHDYWGLENLSHIPGSVGATPVQNVGAYGVEVADLITQVRVYDQQKKRFRNLSPKQCAFAYRDSMFKKSAGKHLVVTAVTFALSRTPQPRLEYKDLAQYFLDTPAPSIDEVREAVIVIRSKKFPDWHEVGTAGSFFKNPVVTAAKYEALKSTYPELPGYEQAGGSYKIALGWVLDKVLNLKGSGTETVGCYQGQALVIVNRGDATAADVQQFADEIVAQVEAAIGVRVEWEVTPIGFVQ